MGQDITKETKGWYGFDLDGTLAEYNGWQADGSIGKPIQPMIERLKDHLAAGDEVRIFTARVWPLGTQEEDYPKNEARVKDAITQGYKINDWCKFYIGCSLPVTCIKDPFMIVLYDDRAKQVVKNIGHLLEDIVVEGQRERG